MVNHIDLIEAVHARNVHRMRRLIRLGVDIDQTDYRPDYTPMNALEFAADLGYLECARVLIDARADVGPVGICHNTPLMCASTSGHVECVRALIDAGSPLDHSDDDGDTALHRACFLGQNECAHALIDAGAALDTVTDDEGRTALMLACDEGHDDCAQALIDAHANIEMTNPEGETALMIACKSPYVVPLSPNATDETKQSLDRLLEERRHGKASCVLALLEQMPQIRELDSHDRAPSLALACDRQRKLEVVLNSEHVIEHAPLAIAKATTLKANAQAVIVDFARGMLP